MSGRAKSHLSVVSAGARASVPSAVGPDTDEGRVVAARGGDLNAWAALYRDHFPALLRYLAYLSGDVDVAEDLAQEAFSTALVKLHQFDQRAAFRSWLRGIATNLFRHQIRKQTRRRRAYLRLEHTEARRARPSSHDPEGTVVRDRRADALREALEALPLTLREAFVMTDVQGLSSQEVAEALSISPGNARVRATRARARIRRHLAEHGHDLDAAGTGEAKG